jgi:hypothetical protein
MLEVYGYGYCMVHRSEGSKKRDEPNETGTISVGKVVEGGSI